MLIAGSSQSALYFFGVTEWRGLSPSHSFTMQNCLFFRTSCFMLTQSNDYIGHDTETHYQGSTKSLMVITCSGKMYLVSPVDILEQFGRCNVQETALSDALFDLRYLSSHSSRKMKCIYSNHLDMVINKSTYTYCYPV